MNILRASLCLALALSTSSILVAAPDHLIGDWQGVLETPVGELTLLVQFQETAGAGLSSEMKSIDQRTGARIPLASIVGTTQRFNLSIPAIGATYDATWNAAEQSWFGEFRQGATLHLELKRGAPATTLVVAGVNGIWRASLQRERASLRLVLHISTGRGGTRAALD